MILRAHPQTDTTKIFHINLGWAGNDSLEMGSGAKASDYKTVTAASS